MDVTIPYSGSGDTAVVAMVFRGANLESPNGGAQAGFDSFPNAKAGAPAMTFSETYCHSVVVLATGNPDLAGNVTNNRSEAFQMMSASGNVGVYAFSGPLGNTTTKSASTLTGEGNFETTYGSYGVTIGIKPAVAGVAPTFVSASTGGSLAGGSPVVTIPADAQEGDLILLLVSGLDNMDASSAPAGYTSEIQANSGGINFEAFSAPYSSGPPPVITDALVTFVIF